MYLVVRKMRCRCWLVDDDAIQSYWGVAAGTYQPIAWRVRRHTRWQAVRIRDLVSLCTER